MESSAAEDAFVQAIQRLVADSGRPSPAKTGPTGLLAEGIGIGDDAALLLGAPRGGFVLSVDEQMEGQHFRRRWASPAAIGRRAAGSALSDLAAMGATPRAALLALAIPDGDAGIALDAVAAFVETLQQFDCELVGGNLTKGPVLRFATTVVGDVEPARALRRDAGRPGHRLWLSGLLGRSALAFKLLEEGLGQPADQALIERYLAPQPKLSLGLSLGALPGSAPAAMDLSDGLLRDLTRLARASGLSALIEDSGIAHPGLADSCARLELTPRLLALSSGEEYELLIAAEPSQELGELGCHLIGELVEGPPGEIRERSGQVIESAGFDHLA